MIYCLQDEINYTKSMIFAFKRIGIMKMPWRILIVVFIVLLGYTLYQGVYDPIPPILIGIFILYIFDSMANAKIEIRTGELLVKMGILTNFTLPIAKIENIDTVDHLFIQGVGIRACGGKEVAVVTTTGTVVRFHLRSKHSLRIFNLIPLSFEKLRLSPEEPDRFIETVNQYQRETRRA